MVTKEQKAFLDCLADSERLCEVCDYAAEGCTGGVRGGPTGPIFPPCTEVDYDGFVDLAALDDLMLEEQRNGQSND